MEPLTLSVDWLAVVIGAVAAYGLGALWYSPKMFGELWMKGVGWKEYQKGSAGPAMITQATGTFLLAWVIGITAAAESINLAILIALTLATLIKANGLFAQKSFTAVRIEAGYILAMVTVMVAVQAVF